MNQTIGPKVHGPLSPQAMLRFMRNSVMPERRDWNAMGPPLPVWFRVYVEEIDPDLVLQFVPPSSHAKGGCCPKQHPFGVWAICRRMAATGWLCKRWVYSMTTADGSPLQPTRDLVELLIRARDMWRNGRMDQMESMFDRAMSAKKQASVVASKERLHERMEQRMRAHGFRDRAVPRISVPGLALP